MILTIKFSHNWNNKLNGFVFTTIRKWEAEKADYYFRNKGQVFTVLLNAKVFGSARLLEVYVESIEDLLGLEGWSVPALLLKLDTGLTDLSTILDLFRKFGVTDKIIILLFERAYSDKFETPKIRNDIRNEYTFVQATAETKSDNTRMVEIEEEKD